MSRSHKVQVTLNEVEYAAVRRRAEAEGLKYAGVVREAIQEYCVKPDRRRRQLEAFEALDALPPVPVPSSWAEWKREYSRLKTGFREADWLRKEPPADTTPGSSGVRESAGSTEAGAAAEVDGPRDLH